jgi:hypothetical protein
LNLSPRPVPMRPAGTNRRRCLATSSDGSEWLTRSARPS